MRKAGKQIDKFSQSIGEKLFKGERTEHSSALRDLEQDIDLRSRGMERLAIASSTYIRSTGKKSKSEDAETADGGKVLPVEQLGLVMVSFGEQLGRESEYGKSLVVLGRAKCKIAAIQDSYVETIGEGYLAGLERAMMQITDYQTSRKKLDSRRLAMDAAAKRAASSKKDSRSLEEDVRTTRERYDETQEDVEARAAEIYDSESNYLDDLNSFLEAEVAFIDRYRETLLEAKITLGSTSTSQSSSRPSLPARRPTLPTPLSFSRARSSPPVDDPDDAPALTSSSLAIPGNRARSNSTKSEGKEKKSLFGSLRKKTSMPRKDTWGSLGDEEREGALNGADSNDEEEREEQRPTANGNRSRSYSSATVMGNGGGGGGGMAPSMSRRNTTPMRMDTGEKTVRSTFAYRATASDELSFDVGEVISITSEVSPDWWVGRSSTTGSSGLFPSAYTEPVSSPAQNSLPLPLPTTARRSASSSNVLDTARRMPPLTRTTATSSFLSDSEPEPFTASEAEGDESETHNDVEQAILTAPGSTAASLAASGGGGTKWLGGKKAPPPPPPVSRSRRSTVSSRDEAYSRGGGTVREEDDEANPFH